VNLTAENNKQLLAALTGVLAREAKYLSSSARASLVDRFADRIGAKTQGRVNRIIYSRSVTRTLVYLAESAGHTLAELRGDSRVQGLVRRRQETYWVLLKHHGLSTTTIGRVMRRNHTTILHGIKKLENLRSVDQWVPPELSELGTDL